MTINCEVCGKSATLSLAHSKNIYYVPKVCGDTCFVSLITKPNDMEAPVALSNRTHLNVDIDKSMRSNYERGFAEWLEERAIPYVYEKYRFTLLDKSVYVPDFFLPKSRTFIEVKGLWLNNGWKKFKSFTTQFYYRAYLVDNGVMRNIKCRPKKLEEIAL